MAAAAPEATAADDFVTYLNAAATGFHSVAEVKRRLRAAGFSELDERKEWILQRGGKHFFSRNGSALCAFTVGGKFDAATSGAVVIGAHTDSPCLKLKPSSSLEKEGCVMLGVVGYGGGLWHTWFDRDLGLAGRVLVREGEDGRLRPRLVRIDKPVARIPNLSIHLSTADERAKGLCPNLQTQAPPLLATALADALWNEKNPADDEAIKQGKTPSASRHHPALVRASSGARTPPQHASLPATPPPCIHTSTSSPRSLSLTSVFTPPPPLHRPFPSLLGASCCYG